MTVIDILFSLVALLGIIYLFFWRFKQYRIDKFRQNIFGIRDNLFDYAAAGNITFSHPAYLTLRNMMNGYIRFSHRISCFRLSGHWFSMSLSKYPVPEFSKTWAEATANLPETKKTELEMFLLRASAHLFHFVFLSSFVKKIVVI